MGRIDEALRRAGRTRHDQEFHRSTGGPFVSPWNGADGDFANEHESNPTPPVTAALPPAPHCPTKSFRSVLGSPIERFAAGWRERLAIGPNSDPQLADQFRRLAATLLHVQRNEKLRTIMVTSALAADGKTLTALNLSLVLSESYRRRVLLVEGDLRRPAMSRVAGVPVGTGLNEALKSHDDRMPSLIQMTETLTILPAGHPDSDPLSTLTSPRLQALLQDASEKFDWVIVDTPPLALTTDATLLSPLVDAALLVVRAGRTPLESIQIAVDALGRERILGIVLNASEQAESVGYEYYGDTTSVRETSLSLTSVSSDSGRL